MLFESDENQKRLIQEVVYDIAPKHNLKKQVLMMKITMIGLMEQNQIMDPVGNWHK